MKNIFLAAAIFSIFTGSPAKAELLDTPELQACFDCVFRNSGSGFFEYETAAWIVQTSDGPTCRFWPPTHESDRQSFHGTIPAGVQGIVHSHPTSRTFMPNDDGDRKAAEQINGPNYVVSYVGVWKYDPSTRQSTQVADSHFWSRTDKTLPKNFCKQYMATHKN